MDWLVRIGEIVLALVLVAIVIMKIGADLYFLHEVILDIHHHPWLLLIWIAFFGSLFLCFYAHFQWHLLWPQIVFGILGVATAGAAIVLPEILSQRTKRH